MMAQLKQPAAGRAVTCPLCGAPPGRPAVVSRERGTIITANWLCMEGHAWSERWTVAA